MNVGNASATRAMIMSAVLGALLCWVAIEAWSSGYQLGKDFALKQAPNRDQH